MHAKGKKDFGVKPREIMEANYGLDILVHLELNPFTRHLSWVPLDFTVIHFLQFISYIHFLQLITLSSVVLFLLPLKNYPFASNHH